MSAKNRRRKLTPFLCHEMLYEYESGLLDRDRHAAVREFLETDGESQAMLEAIRKGLAYTETLAKTQINAEVLAQLRDAENVVSLGRRYSSWRSWPEAVRWSITAIIISASVASVVAAIPWQSITIFSRSKGPETVELARIPMVDGQQGPDATGESNGQQHVADAKAAAAGEEHSDGEEVPIEVVGKVADATDAAKKPMNVPAPTPAAVPASHAKLPPPDEVGEVALNDSDSAPTGEKKEAKAKGFVYRAFMTLSDLSTIAPKVTDEIRALGGQKAGEVELGWKRGTGHYYHFSLPQVNEEKLLEKLRAYGPVRISKDPHPRVMPEGQVRFILWIESAD